MSPQCRWGPLTKPWGAEGFAEAQKSPRESGVKKGHWEGLGQCRDGRATPKLGLCETHVGWVPSGSLPLWGTAGRGFLQGFYLNSQLPPH